MAIGFWKAIRNSFRERKENAAKAMSDPVRDEKFDIADKKKQISEFTSSLALLCAETKKIEQDIAEASGQKTKFDKYAKSAAAKVKAGDTAKDWTALLNQAAGQVSRFGGIVETKREQLDRQKTTEAALRKQLDSARNQIAMREQNLASNAARLKSASITKQLHSAAAGLMDDSGGPDPLDEQVRQAEAESAAVTDLASTPDSELEAAFADTEATSSALADEYLSQ